MVEQWLGGIEMFRGLPASVLEAISGHFEEKTYKKGEFVFLEGDPSQHMWFVKKGRVHAAKTIPTGQSLMVCRVEQGSMFGMCCDMGMKTYQCQTTAATDEVVVVRMPIKRFLELVEKRPEVSRALLETLTKRLSNAQDMRSLSQELVEKRVATVLLTLHKEHGESLPFTRKEIGEMLGVTVETSIRVLSRFEKEGIINSTRGNIHIVKAASLQKLTQAA